MDNNIFCLFLTEIVFSQSYETSKLQMILITNDSTLRRCDLMYFYLFRSGKRVSTFVRRGQVCYEPNLGTRVKFFWSPDYDSSLKRLIFIKV